jgi:hypothetical protein
MTLKMTWAEVFLDPYHKIINNEAIYREMSKFTLEYMRKFTLEYEYMPKFTVPHQEIGYIAKRITLNRRESHFLYMHSHIPRLTSSQYTNV